MVSKKLYTPRKSTDIKVPYQAVDSHHRVIKAKTEVVTKVRGFALRLRRLESKEGKS